MRRHEARGWLGWIGALALCLLAAPVGAVPPQLAHEGLAVDGAGRPLTGQHDVRVRFYRDAVGGAAVFDERHAGVEFFDGYYQLRVGANEALDGAVFDGAVFVALAFDGGPELLPRQPLGSAPGVLVADVAATASGHLHPRSVSVGGAPVIDAAGRWQGALDGIQGPAGGQGLAGPAGPQGPRGPEGPAGGAGSPDTPAQVRAKLVTVDGAGSGLDADTVDGLTLAAFVRSPAQALAAALTADGAGSGLDADRLDGQEAAAFPRDGAGLLALLAGADGAGSGIDLDRLDGREAAEFVRTSAQAKALLVAADGAGSGVDADRLDGLDSAAFARAGGAVTVAANLRANGALAVAQPSLLALSGNAGAPGTCNLGRIGQLYYDTAAGALAGCDGARWVILGGPRSGEVVDGRPTVQWGGNFAEGDFEPTVWRDIPGHAMTFVKGDGHTLLRVAFHSTLGYHTTCHGSTASWRIVVDGKPTRYFQSHGSTRTGWRMQPVNLTFFVQGVPAGTHDLRAQVIRHGCSSDVRAGWPNNGNESFLTVEEVSPSRVAMRTHMPDTRHTPGSWSNLPEREVRYAKQEAGSVIEVVYADTLGYHMQGRGGRACSWRLTMDGNVVDRRFLTYNASHTGWRIDGRTLSWRLEGVPPGDHVFRIQVYRESSTWTSECLAGWPDGAAANALVVQELSPGNSAIRRHMSDRRDTPNSFANLPERELRHTKNSAGSRVRITYMDTLGYHMNGGHTWGCRWRLTVDGGARGRIYATHSSPGTGWRIDPHRLQWVVSGLPAGEHTYRIQADRPNSSGASECLAGYVNGDTGNYLLVEELE